MTCPAPLCADYTLRIYDTATGHLAAELGGGEDWAAEATYTENGFSQIVVAFGASNGCCPVELEVWCYRLELWRGDCRRGCWLYSGTSVEGSWVGVSPMWLALRRPWSKDGTFVRSTTSMFELLLEQADRYDPLGIGLQPAPINVTVTTKAEKAAPLAAAFGQLQTGTLEWTERFNSSGYCSTVTYGDIAYATGYTLTADDWVDQIPSPPQDGTKQASYVRVTSTVSETDDAGVQTERQLVAFWPPAEADGCPPRGSCKVWLPVNLEVEGLIDETEATEVAKRSWEKSANIRFVEAPESGLAKTSDLCVCDLYPGAVFASNIVTGCGTITDDFRMVALTISVVNGKETLVNPTLVGGQA